MIVQRMRLRDNLTITQHRCQQHTARFNRIVALRQTADRLIHAAQVNLGQKAQLAKVDAKGRHAKRRQITRHLQQRTVAAEADRKIKPLQRLRIAFAIRLALILVGNALRQHRNKPPILAQLNKFRQRYADLFFT